MQADTYDIKRTVIEHFNEPVHCKSNDATMKNLNFIVDRSNEIYQQSIDRDILYPADERTDPFFRTSFESFSAVHPKESTKVITKTYSNSKKYCKEHAEAAGQKRASLQKPMKKKISRRKLVKPVGSMFAQNTNDDDESNLAEPAASI